MKMKFRFLTILMVLLAACLFTACDGGVMEELWKDELGNGSDSGDPTPPGPTPPPTPVPVPVTGVSLDPVAIELKVDDSLMLTATIVPKNATDKSVTWNSDDETVATVDNNGKVIAVAAGTAVITVTTKDGGKTATCTVTVKDISSVISYKGASVSLDFINKRYGDQQIDTSKPLTINGINGELNIEGITTENLDLFILSGGYPSGAISKEKTTIYIGGKYENGTPVAGTDGFDFSSSGNNFKDYACKIYANTTGNIKINSGIEGSKIDLSLVSANIVAESPFTTGNLVKGGTLALGDDGFGTAYFTGIDVGLPSNDTLTYTVGGTIMTVTGTNGNDIISIADDAALSMIDLKGSGRDVVKLSATAWSWANAGSSAGHFKIETKENDKVANISFDNFDNTKNGDAGSGSISDIISGLITDTSKTAYFMKITAGGEQNKYLVYNLDGASGLGDTDVVIQIMGANSASGDATTGEITFIGS